MIRYLPCPNCQRHVNRADASCPFCETALLADEPRVSRSLPIGRISRIAVLAGGAAIVGTAAAGCADSPNKTDAGATGGQTATGGHGGTGGEGGTGVGTGGSAGSVGTGGTTAGDAGLIPIYAAAIALPTNKS